MKDLRTVANQGSLAASPGVVGRREWGDFFQMGHLPID